MSVLRKRLSAFLLTLALWVLVGCARAATPTPTLTATYLYNVTEVSLPPTWTPTITHTPRPTNTPTPIPSATPTLSADALCGDFKIISVPDPHVILQSGGIALFAWKAVPQGSSLKIMIRLQGSLAGLNADIPTADDGLLPLPTTSLPGDGYYEWQAFLQHPAFGTICQHSGNFEIRTLYEF